MNEPAEQKTTQPDAPDATTSATTESAAASQDSLQEATPSPSDRADRADRSDIIDPRELVYRGGYRGNPREIIENPAVTPELLETAPEDLRDDLMPQELEDE
jgi:hypothetical protein